MRILFVLEHYHPYVGGAEKLFKVLAESLVTKGHTVHVVTSLHDRQLNKEESVHGVHIHRVPCFNRYLFTLFSIPTIIKLARTSDIIHTTSYNAAFPAWIGSKWTKKPAIITFHEVWGDLWAKLPFASGLIKKGYYFYEQFILKLNFDRFISVSDFTSDALIAHGIDPQKITRIYNGLEYEQMPSLPHDPPAVFTYTYFGRLGISKGLDLLLPAAKKLSLSHPDSKLVLILPRQPKKMLDKIATLVNRLDLADYITLKHDLTRSDLYTCVRQSSCVAIPSYSEGFCFVAAESVALGVPVLSSGQGALQEVVSGPHITMESMTVDGLYNGLVQGYEGKWVSVPIKKFHFKDCIAGYIDLYDSYKIKNNEVA